MAEAATKLPVKTEEKITPPSAPRREWEPLDNLRREVDRLFDEFHRGLRRFPFNRSMFDIEPFWRREMNWGTLLAVDLVEKATLYEITVELPGMDSSNFELKLSNGALTITGEKKEERAGKKNYYLFERRYGAFQRSFRVPESVDADKIEASFKKGVLTVTLPKKPEALKKEKKIAIGAK